MVRKYSLRLTLRSRRARSTRWSKSSGRLMATLTARFIPESHHSLLVDQRGRHQPKLLVWLAYQDKPIEPSQFGGQGRSAPADLLIPEKVENALTDLIG